MNTNEFKIVFVCTDNVGRSVIGEYVLRDYLSKNNIENIDVSSAGTNASSDTTGFSMAQFGRMKELGIDASGHKRIQLTKEIAKKANLLVIFDDSHKKWIKDTLGLNSILFNEIYKNKQSSIRCKDFATNLPMDDKMIEVTDYIYEAIPTFFKKIQKEYL